METPSYLRANFSGTKLRAYYEGVGKSGTTVSKVKLRPHFYKYYKINGSN